MTLKTAGKWKIYEVGQGSFEVWKDGKAVALDEHDVEGAIYIVRVKGGREATLIDSQGNHTSLRF